MYKNNLFICLIVYLNLLFLLIYLYNWIGMNNELWRIRFNWIFFMILGSLYAISYTSISASFHQFVTNPTLQEIEQLNNTAVSSH